MSREDNEQPTKVRLTATANFAQLLTTAEGRDRIRSFNYENGVPVIVRTPTWKRDNELERHSSGDKVFLATMDGAELVHAEIYIIP